MLGRLIVIAGPDQGTVFVIPEGSPFLIGRSHATATQLSDPWVSRTHCRIDASRGMLRLTDEGSKRGTFVNGQRVFDCELRSGDAIRIGTTELRFQAESGESPAVRRSGAVPPSEPSVDEPVPLSGLVGKSVAHFSIRCNLATGATGIVFLAADLRQNRNVALKVLWPTTLHDEDHTQKFLSLMRSMTQLEHPNVVQVYEADKTGPYCWLSMELVEGENLQQVIRRIKSGEVLDWRYAYRVAVQVARAIQAAHGRGIVHRNITPSNILVRVSDQFVKLGDFTLAKLLDGIGASHVSQGGRSQRRRLLYVARTDRSEPRSRRPIRSLQPRGHPLRLAQRPAPVRRRDAHRGHREDPLRQARGSHEIPVRHPRILRGDRSQAARKTARRPLPGGRRAVGRPRTRGGIPARGHVGEAT